MSDAPTFRIDWHAERAEFRHSDTAGRPVDPGPGAHDLVTVPDPDNPGKKKVVPCTCSSCNRVNALQDLRLSHQGEREVPSAESGAVMTEWMAQSAANRMSGFARAIAEGRASLPAVELETLPGREPSPRPGGLLARMHAQRMARGSAR